MCMRIYVMSLFITVIVAGKKGGHKGRVRMYTSPEEIDAQMKAEKERKKVGGPYTQTLSHYLPNRKQDQPSVNSSLKYWPG